MPGDTARLFKPSARYTKINLNQPPPFNQPFIQPFVTPAENPPPGHELPWPIWKSLNRLRTQVGRSKDNLFRWGFSDGSDLSCLCGTAHTMAHLTSCPACPNSCTQEDLMAAADNAVEVAKF